MIKYLDGDIFSSPAQVLVNTVNTMGVMGKGIALEFKKRYPTMFDKYKVMCEKKQLTMGKLALVREIDHWILLFPTKENWRYPSRLEYIEKGLEKFANNYMENDITSIAFPKLGCGNGELNWEDVKELMERYLKPLPIDIYIYLRNTSLTPEHRTVESTLEWLRTNAKDFSFDGLKDDLSNRLLPIEFDYKGKSYNAICNDGLRISSNDDFSVNFNDDELYDIWDYLRNNDIWLLGNDNKDLILETLLKVGYLTKIKVITNNGDKEGYQINKGLGRAYTLKENT